MFRSTTRSKLTIHANSLLRRTQYWKSGTLSRNIRLSEEEKVSDRRPLCLCSICQSIGSSTRAIRERKDERDYIQSRPNTGYWSIIGLRQLSSFTETLRSRRERDRLLPLCRRWPISSVGVSLQPERCSEKERDRRQ